MIHHCYTQYLASLFCIFLLPYSAQGQVKIQGMISDKSGMPVPGVNVILNPKGSDDILAYSLSDGKGFFELNYNKNTDSLQITITSFDYEKSVKLIAGISQTISFVLNEQPVALREVIVKAPSIVQRGDTLNYLVASFAGKEDRVISDILKKLPGIEVSESGEIKYNGKAINKFYVENMDLLQGRYGIATNNIAAKDVASVQVYEDHQPIRALAQTDFTDQAAINLKLKDNIKGTLSAMAQLGIGACPLLWDNELVTLYFSKKNQNINTYKGNNTGNDVPQEFSTFYSDNNNNPLYEGRLLSILAPSPPPVGTKRYLFNNINAVSANLLHVLKNDYEFTTNVSFYNDTRTKDSYSRSTYYLSGDSLLQVNEALNARQTLNKLDAAFKISTNKDRFYLSNVVNVKAGWDEQSGRTATSDTIGQQLIANAYNISNTFSLINTLPNKNNIRIYSFNGYVRTPQYLYVQPALYEDVISPSHAFEQLMQSTMFNNFSSNTLFSYGISRKQFNQHYMGGVEVELQSLNTELQAQHANGMPVDTAPDSLQNDLYWQKYKAYLTGDYNYVWRRFRIEALLPLSQHFLLIDDRKISQDRQVISRFLFNPLVALTYSMNNFWRVKAQYNFYNNLGAIEDSYTGYIMQNYRNLNRNDGQLADNSTHYYSLRLSYRNASKALFGHINASFSRSISNMLREQYFVGVLQVQNTINKQVTSDIYGVSGAVSKNVYALRSIVSLAASYYNVFSSQMSQGELVDYRYYNYGIKPVIESQVGSWGGISYSVVWSESRSILKSNTVDFPGIRSVSNNLKINLFPVSNLSLRVGYENYYNNAVSGGQSQSFVDLNVRYKYKGIEYTLVWINIFNNKQHITASYNEISELLYAYEIRPSQLLLTIRFKLF